MQWNTQAGNITTNLKVGVYFTLPTISATNVLTWKCHVDDSAKGGYDMILWQDILTELRFNLKLSDQVILVYDGTFKGSTTPMIDLGAYEFKDLNTRKITAGEFFTNDYTEEVYFDVVAYQPPSGAVWPNYELVEFQSWSVTTMSLGSVAYCYEAE